ncbi:Signal transduction histidine kinase [Filimonas lacunae]|uniref:Signal transduction histidine kinase n=1 Tax=Filimonas lacunae TaxID=477680 RepID=A0A173MQT9_9BACT|nr:sensor histidine kinase [Filimonas lacunae]BAV10033.1 sensory box/GGDEF family protein [Filimonas lacunae]SIS82909.1 Signal transduction histidine kinase [Filimonas lacunae]
MNRIVPYIIFLLLLLYPNPLYSQALSPLSNNFQFELYNTNNGLTDNFISKIVTDKKGFLWIATKNGLSRYDGFHFKNYTHIPGDSSSLRSIWTTDMLLDSQGTLWVSTEGGICYYDEVNDCFRYINTSKDMQVLYKAPLCPGNDRSTIWVAAEDGLCRINTITKTFTHTSLHRTPDPQCIISDNHNRIWIGTRTNGMYRYDGTTHQHQKLNIPVIPADCQIMDFYKDTDGMVYGGTNAGLLCINDTTIQLFNKGSGNVSTTDFDDIMCITSFPKLTGPDRLLCGTYDNKVLVFDKNKKAFIYSWQNTNAKLSNMPHGIFSCLFTLHNILWIGTDHGMYKLNLDKQDIVTENIPQIMFSSNIVLVKQILQDPEQKHLLWMTLDKPLGGIAIYNTTQKKVTHWLQTLPKGKCPETCTAYNDLLTDNKGRIWALNDKEIHCYNTKTHSLTKHMLPRICMSADLDKENNLWIGTDKGILHYNTQTREYKLFDHVFNGTPVENSSLWWQFAATGIRHDGAHTVWVTSIKYGLFSFNCNTAQFTPHRQPFNTCYETKNRCSSLSFDSAGNIWIGTMAGLTTYYPRNDSFVNYNRIHGLQSTYVYSIRMDNRECIWGRGNSGIFYYDIAHKKFTNFLLPAEQSSAFFKQRISRADNKILAGFEGGYNIFDAPTLSTGNEAPPQPYIADCHVMNNRYYYNRDSVAFQQASFGHHASIFRFDFSAINYNDNNNATFLYMLDGLDKEWQKTDMPSYASYTHLSPGKYTFKVKTRNSAGIESTVIATFPFTIQSAFWQTWWFYTLIACALMALLYALYQVRIKRVTALYRLRSKISKDLHDDIGAALSSISIMSAVTQRKIDSHPQEAKIVATRIENTSRNMVGAISDMVWSINPDIDTLEQIIIRLREYMSNMFDETQTQYLLHCSPQLLTRKISMELRKDIYLISKEIINNTVKYSAAKHFTLYFSIEQHMLVMNAEDDGVGFDTTQTKKGNGLYNIIQRVKEQKGRSSITSDNNGTRWLIKMPLLK